MVNTVLTALTKALGTTFGNTYHYYVENVEQKFQKPCFTVDVLAPTERSISAKNYYRTMPIVIHYFSNNKNTPKSESYNIAEQVLECIEHLNIGGRLVRAEDISYTMVEDVLQIFVTYRFWTQKPEVITNMEVLEKTNFK